MANLIGLTVTCGLEAHLHGVDGALPCVPDYVKIMRSHILGQLGATSIQSCTLSAQTERNWNDEDAQGCLLLALITFLMVTDLGYLSCLTCTV